MRIIIAALILAMINATAFALSMSQNGYAWSKASAQEKEALVRDAVQRLNARYPWAEMRACVDSAYRRGAADYVLQEEIAAVMAVCHVQLK